MNNVSFFKNVRTLVSGTLGSQIILLSITPILTRLYSTEQFGVLSLFVSIVGILSVISSLRYNRAIPLPESDLEASQILWLGTAIVITFSFIISMVIFFIPEQLIIHLNIDTIYEFIWWVPVSVLFLGLFDLYSYWGIRSGSFLSISLGKLLQTSTISAVQLFFSKVGAIALIVGHSLGQLVGFTILIFGLLNSIKKVELDFKKIKLLAIRYKDFPLYSTWEAFANSLGNNLPVILLAYFYGASSAALFALTYKVLSMPMNIVGGAVGQAFFAQASDAYREGTISKVTSNLFRVLCNVGIPPALTLIIIGPDLFSWVFGESWRGAGFYAQLMSPWLLFIFISSPLSSLISVAEKQKKGLIFQLVFLSSKICALLVGCYYFDVEVTLALLAVISTLSLIVFLYWIFTISKSNKKIALYVFFKSCVFAVIYNSPLLLAVLMYDNIYSLVIGLFLTALIISIRFYMIKKDN